VTRTWKDSKDVPTPNMLPPSSSSSSWLIHVHVSIVRFRVWCASLFSFLPTFPKFLCMCNYFL
jgi:hypothetical protein